MDVFDWGDANSRLVRFGCVGQHDHTIKIVLNSVITLHTWKVYLHKKAKHVCTRKGNVHTKIPCTILSLAYFRDIPMKSCETEQNPLLYVILLHIQFLVLIKI